MHGYTEGYSRWSESADRYVFAACFVKSYAGSLMTKHTASLNASEKDSRTSHPCSLSSSFAALTEAVRPTLNSRAQMFPFAKRRSPGSGPSWSAMDGLQPALSFMPVTLSERSSCFTMSVEARTVATPTLAAVERI